MKFCKTMNSADIEAIEKTIGYTFRNKALLIQAFTRRSFCNERRQSGDDSCECNEVLEFLGDSVLGCSVASALLFRYSSVDENGMHTKLSEGNCSVIKSNLSDKSMLSSRISELGLEKYFLLGEGDRRENISKQPSVMEDLFESLIGAVFIDSGYNFDIASKAVGKMLDTEQFLKKNYKKSPKTVIQEYAQARRYKFSYIDLGEEGPEHEKVFHRALEINGVRYPAASGKNVKSAETSAAENAIRKLGI